ncbi:MAG TPA: type 1 glutamine amidotransferase [Planctomycetota bacterium]|nr:type 1 glutamine amidotransferase [Planctomycetota bacterium]
MNRPWIVIQHVPFEGPGLWAEEAERRGIPLRVVRTDRSDPVPDPSGLDAFGGLIVMGGPMSVRDAPRLKHLDLERRLLAEAARRGIPAVGVCLGAQLLASAFGAEVYPGPAPEIGFGSVRLTEEGRRDPVLGPEAELPVFHWHGETFDLPRGAVWLARSEAYPHQAFRIGANAYGLQFHVELNAPLAEAWAPHLPEGVRIVPSERESVERSGRRVIARFFDRAADRPERSRST